VASLLETATAWLRTLQGLRRGDPHQTRSQGSGDGSQGSSSEQPRSWTAIPSWPETPSISNELRG